MQTSQKSSSDLETKGIVLSQVYVVVLDLSRWYLAMFD